MDGKLWRENRKRNFFGVCLVMWGEKKINNGVQVFFIHVIPPPNKHTLSSFLFYFYFLLSGIEFLVYNVYGNRNSGKSKLQLYLLQYKILNWRSKPSSISKRYKILTLFVHFLLLFGNGFLLIEVVCLCCFDIFIGFWSTPFL